MNELRAAYEEDFKATSSHWLKFPGRDRRRFSGRFSSSLAPWKVPPECTSAMDMKSDRLTDLDAVHEIKCLAGAGTLLFLSLSITGLTTNLSWMMHLVDDFASADVILGRHVALPIIVNHPS